ncbi:MAG: hypothetical protein QXH91_03785 [Candidatus Bathyarchaeia archaeon]
MRLESAISSCCFEVIAESPTEDEQKCERSGRRSECAVRKERENRDVKDISKRIRFETKT